MKKSFVGITVLSLSLIVVSTVFAENRGKSFMARPTVREEIKELRLSGTPGVMRRLIHWANLTAINGSTLTVHTKTGKDFQVNVTSDTKLYRRFGAVAILSELQVGDWLEVIGQWTDSSNTAINALVIRDQSIQKYHGTFNGTVVSVNVGAGTFVFQPNKRTNQQTVTVTSTTKVYGKNKQQVITLSEIKIGDHVVVRGTWDRVSHTITETVLVKDLSVISP